MRGRHQAVVWLNEFDMISVADHDGSTAYSDGTEVDEMTQEVSIACDGGCGKRFARAVGVAVDWAPVGWMIISILRAMDGRVMWTPFGTIAKPTDGRRLKAFCSWQCVIAWGASHGDTAATGLVWKDGRPPQFVPWEERYPATSNDGTNEAKEN